jgi:hypothetical protein
LAGAERLGAEDLALLSGLPGTDELGLAAQLAYWQPNGPEIEMPPSGSGDAKMMRTQKLEELAGLGLVRQFAIGLMISLGEQTTDVPNIAEAYHF